MKTIYKISVIAVASSLLLVGCKPGPVTFGSHSVMPTTNYPKHADNINYKVNKKRVVDIPKSSGDQRIINKIMAAYQQDPILSQLNIQVSAHRGEVTLMGKVPNKSVKAYAIRTARYTKGVMMVRDRLVIGS